MKRFFRTLIASCTLLCACGPKRYLSVDTVEATPSPTLNQTPTQGGIVTPTPLPTPTPTPTVSCAVPSCFSSWNGRIYYDMGNGDCLITSAQELRAIQGVLGIPSSAAPIPRTAPPGALIGNCTYPANTPIQLGSDVYAYLGNNVVCYVSSTAQEDKLGWDIYGVTPFPYFSGQDFSNSGWTLGGPNCLQNVGN